MKIIRFFTIILTPLVLSVFLCMGVFKICNINTPAVWDIVLSKIPIVKSFHETTTSTGLYGISQQDKQELRTASYNIDFIASFTGAGTKYIAIYPYLIEAGVDLGKATHDVVNNQTIVTLPNAQITVARINEKNQVQVIREKGNKLDYNTHIKPLKMAFEKSAKDLALQAGILEDANEKAEKYLQELFKGQNYVFQKEQTEYETLRNVYTQYIPLTFNYSPHNFEKGDLYGTHSWGRDCLELSSPNYNLGYSGSIGRMTQTEIENSISGWFETYNSYCQKQNQGSPIILKLLNPLDMKYTRTYFNASDGYNTGLVRSKEHLFYMISNAKDAETQSQQNAPEMLYLSMMLSSNEYEGYDEYNDWSWNYTKCLQSVRDKRYHETLSLLSKMESTRKYCAKRDSVDASQTYGEFWMQSLAQIMTNKKYTVQNDDSWVNQRLDLLYYLKSTRYKQLDDDEQNRILAGDIGDDDFKLGLKELFYLLPKTSLSQREQYAEDLINAAQSYNYIIANTLKGKDFSKYMATVMYRYDNEYRYTGEISGLTVLGHEENLNDKLFGDYYGVKEILKQNKLLDEKNGQIALLFKVGNGLLRKDSRNILLLDKSGCRVLENATYAAGKVSVENIYQSSYENVNYTMSSDGRYSFMVGGYQHKGKAIAMLFKDIKRSMENDKAQSVDDFVSDLEESHISNILHNYWRP